MTPWVPLVSEDTCPDCGEGFDQAHQLGCAVGDSVLEECLRDEAIERAIDDRKLGH